MDIVNIILTYVEALPVWVNALTAAFVGIKTITMLTPTKTDNKIVDAILTVLNVLALNINKDKNADA